MKRLLLVFLVLFSLQAIQAQRDARYTLDILGFIGEGSSGCGSLNGLQRLILHYDDANGIARSRVILGLPDLPGQGRNFINQEYTYLETFDIDIELKQLEIHTVNAFRNGTSCDNGSVNERFMDISSPCTYRVQSNVGGANRGSIYHPNISGNIRVKVSPVMELAFADGTPTGNINVGCSSTPIEIKASSGFSSSLYNWEFLDITNEKEITHPDYQALLDERQDAIDDADHCASGCEDEDAVGDTVQRCEDDCLADEQPRMDAVAEEIRLYLAAGRPTTAIVSDFQWKTIPVNKSGQTTVDIKLSDLYPNVEDQSEVLGKTLDIRINTNCVDEIATVRPFETTYTFSNQLAVQFLPDPPNIIDVNFPERECAGDEVTALTMDFDRPLLSGEQLNVNIVKRQANGSYIGYFNNAPGEDQDDVTIRLTRINDNRYRYVLPIEDDLTDGDYRVDTFSFFSGSGLASCGKSVDLENDDSVYKFNVDSPDPITFEVEATRKNCSPTSSNGHATITNITNGSGSYQYSIDNNAWVTIRSLPSDIRGLTNGIHEIKVRDAVNTACVSDEETVNIESSVQLSINNVTQENPDSPRTATGSLTVGSITGGVPFIDRNGNPYYNIEEFEYDTVRDDEGISEFTVLASGFERNNLRGEPFEYTYTITDSNGCRVGISSFTLRDPEPLSLGIDFNGNFSCSDSEDVEIIANVNGGYTPYKYTWHKEGSLLVGQTGSSIFASSTEYSVFVEDARGIKQSITNFSTPAAPSPVTLSGSVRSPQCFGDDAVFTMTGRGGQGGYLYAVVDGPISSLTWQRGNTFELPVTSTGYRFIAKDRADCTSEISNIIFATQPPEMVLSLFKTTNNNIKGANDGSIELTVNGGTSPYVISWRKNGVNITNRGLSISGIGAGDYIATVTDNEGCTVSSELIEITEPNALTAIINASINIDCFGGVGTLTVLAQGGIGSYVYQWYSEGVKIDGAVRASLLDVGEGNYSVEVTEDFTSVTSEIFIFSQPRELSLTGSSMDASCFAGDDGAIILSPEGGTLPYSFSIDNKLTYISNTSLSDSTIDNLTKGDYQVWLKDANNCELPTPVSFSIGEPKPIVINETILPVTIAGGNNGSIAIDVTDGVPPYTYSWTKDGDTSFSEKTVKDIDNLTTGFYIVKVTDANECSIDSTFEVQEPKPFKVSLGLINTIQCHDDGDGNLMATVEGGFPIISTINDFKFEWFKTETNIDRPIAEGDGLIEIIDLEIGTYKVVVTDQAGTQTEDTILITQPDDLQVSLTRMPINVNCFGDSTGIIDVTVVGGPTDEIAGGYLPYTFEWTKVGDLDFRETTEDLVNISAGTYTLTVTDSNLCETTLSAPVIISEPLAELIISDSNITNLTGFETDNGAISVSVEGGTVGYSYEWRFAGNDDIIGDTALIENLAIGTYELTVTDANNCTVEGVYTLIEPALLSINNIDEQGVVLCNGDKSVTLTASVDGGVPDYTYSWYNAADTSIEISRTETLSDITGGTYNLIVTDVNGNEANESYVVSQPDILEASFTTTNVSCSGGNNGAIDVSVIGGTGIYSYSWATGESTQDISGLVFGNYSVTVRDENLCETTLNISINEPVEALNVSNVNIVNASGFELTNGSIEIVIAGGTEGYSYEWKDLNDMILPSTTNLLEGIGAGDYFLEVTDANNCILRSQYNITEPSALLVNTDEVSIDCFENTGALNAIVEGGVPPYIYAWYNIDGELISEESTASDILAGTYTVIVTDAKANQAELNDIVLTHPDLLEIESINVTNVTCYEGDDGAIQIIIIGGTGDYLYQWNHTSVSSNEVADLVAGEYTVTITDENTCSVTSETISVVQPEPYKIISVSLVRPSGIIGAENGSISIDIIGGVAPFTYEWLNSDSDTILLETNVANTSSSITTSEGVYSIKVTDAIGCEMGDIYNLADPGELLVAVEQNQQVSCFGNNDGILEVITVGGVGGNNYQWYSRLAGIDTPITGETSAVLRNLSIGSYYVVVSNAEGISEQSSVFEVVEPDAIIGELEMDMPDCYQGDDGSITLTASGGNNDYSYRYRKDRTTYSDWIAFNGNETELSTLSKGYYEIQLRDSNGCFYETASRDIEVLVADITEPDELVVSSTSLSEPTGFNLSNGVIVITAQGGTLPYTYEWSSVEGEILTEITNELSGITAGGYNINITDSQLCRVSLTMTLGQPEELLVTIEEVNVISCFESSNGSLRAKATGGVGTYTYEWFEVGNTIAIEDEVLLDNINRGEYYVVVTDANGNVKQSENTFVVEPALLEVNLTADYVLCGDGNDWDIESVVQGGTAPYTYFWNTGVTTSSIENTTLGTYTLFIADARGCTANANIDLVAPPAISVVDTIINPTCFEGGDGSVELSISGGVAPYSYEWNNGITESGIFNLSAGSYQVIITDAKGCAVVHIYDVIDPAPIVVDLGSDITLCKGQVAELDATIDDPNAIYSWTSENGFRSNEPNVVVNATGIYQVDVLSGDGCTANGSIFVEATSNEIAAHFLTSTQVFVGEEFVIVDNSVPFPDSKEWQLPNEAIVSFSDENYVELHFDEAGEYEVTLFAERGLCSAFQTKKIVVLEKEFDDSDDAINSRENLNSFIDFNLYPNPSIGGDFSIDIELSEAADVSLKLLSMIDNVVLDSRGDRDNDKYNFIYNIRGLPSGIYFLSLEVSNGMSRVYKLVIN